MAVYREREPRIPQRAQMPEEALGAIIANDEHGQRTFF